MSRWTDNFQNIGIAAGLQSVIEILKKLDIVALQPQTRTEFDRAMKVLQVIQSRVASIDPELFHANVWANFPTWLAQLKSYAESSLVNSQNPQNFISALNGTLDEMLNALRPADINLSLEGIKALSEAIENYRMRILDEIKTSRSSVQTSKKDFENFAGKIKESEKTIASQNLRLDASIAEYQKQFSTAQESRNEVFAKALIAYSESHKKAEEKFTQEFKAESSERASSWSALIDKTASASDAHLGFLEKRKKEVDEIFGAIGSAALAGHFNKVADQERHAADTWRNTALRLFELVNAIADQMISHPKGVAEMYAKLPAAKRKAIESRDKK